VAREISRLNNAIEKVVVSDRLTVDQISPWLNTRIVRRADAHGAISDLKSGQGREILMFGSHILWNDLLAHGLVDELHLMIGAGVLTAGTPAFEVKPPGPLRLLGTRTWPGSGLMLARYAAEPAT
jgi:dihydrofolate reductase